VVEDSQTDRWLDVVCQAVVVTELTPEEQKSEVKKAIWKKLIEAHVKRLEKREDNTCKVYMLIFGQCSEVVRSKLESMSTYTVMQSKFDIVELLTSIQTVMFSYQGQQNKTHALIDAQKRLMSMYQDSTMTPREVQGHGTSGQTLWWTNWV
jgi:hypothetical protein